MPPLIVSLPFSPKSVSFAPSPFIKSLPSPPQIVLVLLSAIILSACEVALIFSTFETISLPLPVICPFNKFAFIAYCDDE